MEFVSCHSVGTNSCKVAPGFCENLLYPCIIHDIRGKEKIPLLLDEPYLMLTEFKLLSATLGVLKQNLCTIPWYRTLDNTNLMFS